MPLNNPQKKQRFNDSNAPDGDAPRPGSLASHLRAESKSDAMRSELRLIPVADIKPDPAQPRRAVPRFLQDDSLKIGDILENWRLLAQDILQKPVHAAHFIMSSDESLPLMASAENIPIVNSLFELYGLAADIFDNGQNDVIDVIESGSGYRIVAGERRWLAFNLLQRHVDAENFRLIEAEILNKPDVWRQASENGNRRRLNAVQMARQIALLIMDMYPDADFFPFDEIMACDREFYMQVADGNKWRILRGYSKRLLDVTGLKSTDMLRKYRAILTVNDVLWELADAYDYTEFRIREASTELDNQWFLDRQDLEINELHNELEEKLRQIRDEKSADTVTTVTVYPPQDAAKYSHENTYTPPRNPVQAIDDAVFSDSDPAPTPTGKTPQNAFIDLPKQAIDLIQYAVDYGSADVSRIHVGICDLLADAGYATYDVSSKTLTPTALAYATFAPTPDNPVSSGLNDAPDWATNDPDREMLPLTDPERPPEFEDARSGVMVTLGERVTTPAGRVMTVSGQGADPNFVTLTDDDGNDQRFAVDDLQRHSPQVIEAPGTIHLLNSISQHLAALIENKHDAQLLLDAMNTLAASSRASLAASEDIEPLLVYVDELLLKAFDLLVADYRKQADKIINVWNETHEE